MLRTRRLEPIADMIAPTERCPWRKRVLCGEVHDDNAFAMGGVAGHAGLFSSARDIDRIATQMDSFSDEFSNILQRNVAAQPLRFSQRDGFVFFPPNEFHGFANRP